MKNSNRKNAQMAGWSLLLMAVAAGYAYGYVQGTLVIPESSIKTLENLKVNTSLFGTGVLAWLVILTTDLLVAWSLFQYFKKVDFRVSAISGMIRGAYSAVLAYAILQLIAIWQLIPEGSHDAQMIMDLFTDFENYWSLGLIIFGLHLLGLGYLSYKSRVVPRWIGFLLYVAGLSYTCFNGAKAILPEASETIAKAEMMMSVPMAIAELGLAVWLIWKGGKK